MATEKKPGINDRFSVEMAGFTLGVNPLLFTFVEDAGCFVVFSLGYPQYGLLFVVVGCTLWCKL